MPTAFFQAIFSNSAIDADAGVIRGVKIMELGHVAKFADDKGQSRSVKITKAHISRLLGFAGNRSVVSHGTHEWHSSKGSATADSTEMAARLGAFKNHRTDESGNLIADYYLRPEPAIRSEVLWAAEHNPEDNQISVVFSYDKNDPLCLPLDYQAADLVPRGAAVTAMFSEDNKPKSILMTDADKEEMRAFFRELLAEPDTKTALLKLAPEPKAATVDAKAIEDAVKTALDTHKVALLAEAKIAGEAGATQFIGTGKFIKQSDADASANEVEAAIAGYITSGAKNRGVAILRLANDKPALYNSAVAAGKI